MFQLARTASTTDEIQHAISTGQLGDFETHSQYPNCALFNLAYGSAARNAKDFYVAVLLYAAPLREVTQIDSLYTPDVAGTLVPPRFGTQESWYPAELHNLLQHQQQDESSSSKTVCDVPDYRVYMTLVLRIVVLQRMIKYMATTSADEKTSAQKKKWATDNEATLYKWLDAQLMLAMAIDELGYIPRDDSPEMTTLLDNYSPDVHMAFTESELPDLSRQIRRCAFFTKRENGRKDDPILDSIEKCLPERCLSRESAMKTADISVSDTGYFAWIKLLLAAMYLGVYHTSVYRGSWRYRWAIYRLFFFTMHPSLRPLCMARQSDGVQGGSAAYLAAEYNLNELYDSMGIDETQSAPSTSLKKTRGGRARSQTKRAKKVLTQIQFRHYPTIVSLTYRAETSLDAPRRRTRSAPPAFLNSINVAAKPQLSTPAAAAVDPDDDVDDKQPEKTTSTTTVGPPPPPPLKTTSTSGSQRRTMPKLRDAAMRSLISARHSSAEMQARQGLAIDYGAVMADADFKQGLAVANAISRLTVEKNRGSMYFEQRKETYMAAMAAAAPTTESSNDGAGANAEPIINEPLPPYELGAEIRYREALKRVIAFDRRMPDEEELQRDSILFHAISSVITRRKEGATNGDKEYTYQNAVNLALRLYLMFGLERWNESMLNELCARTTQLDEQCTRTDWATWQLGNSLIADTLRCNLDALYTQPCKLGAFLTTYEPYERMKESAGDSERTAIVNNLYTLEKEAFLPALLRTMTTFLNNEGFADRPIDFVPPTETAIMIRHLLMYWRFPRYAPPIDFDSIRKAKKAETTATTTTSISLNPFQAQTTQQLHEYILPAQVSFLIEPTTKLPAANATREEIEREFVKPAQFPLALFHVDDVSILEFRRTRHVYHLSPSDTVVEDYAESLATRSMYQFLVMYIYLQAIASHMSQYTWPLPRHIVDHQLRTLRAHYCIPIDKPVPAHLLRTLVCMGCQRCSAVMPTLRKQQSLHGDSSLGAGIDIGCDHVRWVEETDDDIVFDAVRRRGGMLMPLNDMRSAETWTKVLHHRARLYRKCYDRYCAESLEETEEMLEHPERFGMLPVKPTEEEIDAHTHRLFADMWNDENVERFEKPTDLRTKIVPLSRPNAPLHLVASGRGKIGELEFDERLASEANKRMQLYQPPGSRSKSFQMWGHALSNRDRRYDTVRFVDASQRIKAETKKTKQLDNNKRIIDGIVESAEREMSIKTYDARRRRDAQSMERVAQCSRQQMLEVDLCGRALVQEQIFVVGRTQQTVDDDFLMACCDCLGKVRGSEAFPISDRVVCKPCYNASQLRGGVVAKRLVRGESTKSMSTAKMSALTANSAEMMRLEPNQRMLSPSFKALHSSVVPNGTPCAMDRCRTIKTDVNPMYGLQVLRDIDVGNETYGYIFFCKNHAALYVPLFKSPFVVPLSSIKIFMLEGVRKFDMNLTTSGNFLDRYLRSAAQSAHVGTMERHRVETEKKQKKLINKKRKQQKAEAEAAAAEAAAAKQTAQAIGGNSVAMSRKRKSIDDDNDD